ncbi:MAG: TA system antitoxin ParD family protein [Marmoricola sp.]
MSSMPTRIEADLFEAAASTGAVVRRSATQQLNYWARLGREFESARGVSQRDIEAVLSGRSSYDDLGALDQAVVRTAWDEGIGEARASLNLAEEFLAAGETWTEGDAAGRAHVRASAPRAATRSSTTKKAVKKTVKKTRTSKPA